MLWRCVLVAPRCVEAPAVARARRGLLAAQCFHLFVSRQTGDVRLARGKRAHTSIAFEDESTRTRGCAFLNQKIRVVSYVRDRVPPRPPRRALAFCAARARARDPPYVLPTGRAAPSHCVRMSAGYPLPLVPRRVVPCIGIHARRLVAASPPAPDGAGAWTAPPPPAAPQVRRTLVVCRVRVRVRGAVPRSASALRIESP